MEAGSALPVVDTGLVQPTRREGRLTLQELKPTQPALDMTTEVRIGLSAARKWLPPKYFYDAHGSQLFEKICATREYYPSRVEDQLLAEWADEIVADTRPRTLIELGAGSARKTRRFFDACELAECDAHYVPVDVCGEMLVEAGQALLQHYDWLKIDAVVGDYTRGLAHLPRTHGPQVFLFLGGTLGNFDEDAALAFLRDLRAAMRPGDALVLGADRIKDQAVLNAAYNDAAGLTAAFNLNVLSVLNRELNADFEPANFSHYAFYNRASARVEMHLRANIAHTVNIPSVGAIAFRAGETILTEISRKFSYESLNALLHDAGFSVYRHYQPDDQSYSLVLAHPR